MVSSRDLSKAKQALASTLSEAGSPRESMRTSLPARSVNAGRCLLTDCLLLECLLVDCCHLSVSSLSVAVIFLSVVC